MDKRLDSVAVERQAAAISASSELQTLVDSLPDIVIGVNESRQIIFANAAATRFFQVQKPQLLWGKRFGEIVGCLHSTDSEGGCGEGDACRLCGGLQTMLGALSGVCTERECRVALESAEAKDLRLWGRPVKVGEDQCAFISLRDISNEKRRELLERTFFHDLMNTAGGLQSVSHLMEDSAPDELNEFRDMIVQLADQLVDEIGAQRMLMSAEHGNLAVDPRPIDSVSLLNEVARTFSRHPVGIGRRITIDPKSQDLLIESDPVLLRRCLGNMVKNALEAIPEGGNVVLGVHKISEEIVQFSVHNDTFMPVDIQLQIFQRSFSTKGTGRGVGTYSIRLFGEKYLQGRVHFCSSEREGTDFFIDLPTKLSAHERFTPSSSK